MSISDEDDTVRRVAVMNVVCLEKQNKFSLSPEAGAGGKSYSCNSKVFFLEETNSSSDCISHYHIYR